MKIAMAKELIFKCKNSLPEIFSETAIEYAFGENRPSIGDDSDENFRGFLGGDDVGNKSGIYIFATEFDEILYIGKATKNNLHNRVWDHVKTPKRLAYKNGWMTFPNTQFTCHSRPELVEDIRNGYGKLHIFTVSNLEAISVLETYLQVMFIKINGYLPPFNKQIG